MNPPPFHSIQNHSESKVNTLQQDNTTANNPRIQNLQNKQNKNYGITILQWNANSITNKKTELLQYIQKDKQNFPKIICIQETLLGQNKNINIPNYDIIRKDNCATKGGVLIAIHSMVSYTQIKTPQNIEALAIKINTSNSSECIYIFNIYSSPSSELDLDFILDICDTNNDKILILGDLNAHHKSWRSKYPNTKGNYINKFLEENSLVLLNDTIPTHNCFTGNFSLIDLSIASTNLALDTNINILENTFGSDHHPILIQLNTTIQDNFEPVEKYNLKNADWNAFKKSIHLPFEELYDENIDIFYTNILGKIISAADHSIPKTNTNKNRKQNKTVPYWNNNCKESVRKRNKALKHFKNNPNNSNFKEYKLAKSSAQRTIRNEQNKYWEEYCNSLSETSKLTKVWKMAKRMTGKVTHSNLPCLIQDNNTYTANIDKANIFANHFASVSKNKNLTNNFIRRKNKLEKRWKNILPQYNEETSYLNQPLNLFELTRAIKQTKKSSAPGEDNIPYEIIKHLPNTCLNTILELYNIIWQTQSLPKAWKTSLIIPIPKSGEPPTNPNSYRPIALTASLCKIMERIITNRLIWHLESNNLLNPAQTGFRYKRNTIDQIIRLHDAANKSINNKGYTAAVFLDLSKAFDMLWKDGLLCKLRKLNLHGNIYHWIKEFLTDRQIKVRIGNTTSETYKLQNGVPQGSVISPILFILLMNDFPSLSDDNIETSLFADDSAIWKSGKNLQYIKSQLQKRLNEIIKWTNKWGLKINPLKTKIIIFTRKLKPINNFSLDINGIEIKPENEIKFLGMIFDKRLNWRAHISYLLEKSKKAINLLKIVSHKSWSASKTTLLNIYKALIRSRLDYGSEVFYTASKKSLAKLDSIQYQCLKICTKALTSTPLISLQNECGELPLDLRRQKLLLNHILRITTVSNNPANTCLQDTWHNYYGKFGDKNKKPIISQLRKAKHIFENYTDKPIHTLLPSWNLPPFDVDIQLKEKINKQHDNQLLIKQYALQHMTIYDHCTSIFTDGSRNNNETVGMGIYIPRLNKQISFRLKDNTSIYTAELTAIKLAIQWITQNKANSRDNYVIYTDSLSSVLTLSNISTTPADTLTRELIYLRKKLIDLNIHVSICWIPSHIGILGNSMADNLAKTATHKNQIDIDIGKGINECRQDLHDLIIKLWQKRYDKSGKNLHYKQIEPSVSTKVKYTSTNRHKEITITRLRLGKCRLKNTLFKMKLADSPLCDTCNTHETIKHFLTECKKFNFKTPHLNNIKALLTNKSMIAHIYQTIRKNKILI